MATAIFAAGGILVTHDAGADKIALVNRADAPGGMRLPEGEIKIAEGEEISDAAKRAVKRETGCTGENPTFAGTIYYYVGDTLKILFVCKMKLSDEASTGQEDRQQDVEWMRPVEAVQRLTHEETRRLISELFGVSSTQVQGDDSFWSKVAKTWRGNSGSAERDRLADKIAETRIDLDLQVQSSSNKASLSQARVPYQYLAQAEQSLKCCNLQRGWVNVLSARRSALAIFKDVHEVNRVAAILRHESERVTGWRSKAIADLIHDAGSASGPSAVAAGADDRLPKLVTALYLLDDYSNTSYFKILLRRRHLFNLFVLLGAAVFCSLFFWSLPHCLHGIGGRFLIVLCGVLGAGVSVTQNLLSTDVSAKIPAQQIGAFLVWMRPAIGAAAALFAVALIKAGSALKFFDDKIEHNVGAILVIAFAAGFSERFITQAIEKISDKSDKR